MFFFQYKKVACGCNIFNCVGLWRYLWMPMLTIFIWLIVPVILPSGSSLTVKKTHGGELYYHMAWPAVTTRRNNHWRVSLYKTIPLYMCNLIVHKSAVHCSFCSCDFLLLLVPLGHVEMGKKAFVFLQFLACNTADWLETDRLGISESF